MRKLVVLSIVVAALGGGVATNTAQASSSMKNSAMISLETKMKVLKRTIARDHDRITTGYSWHTTKRGNGYVIQVVNAVIDVRLAKLHLKSTQKRLAGTFQQWKHERTRYLSYLVGDMNAWLCIHSKEGAWNDPNPPYYGGLQMDLSFQRHYAPELLKSKGTADHWTPLEQIVTAQKAHRMGRGYYPWPNTARACGLI